MRLTPTVATTMTMSLDATVERLAAHHLVDGILLMGSMGSDELTPDSDYDVLLVLDTETAPVRMVNTWVDGRLTEVYCVTVRAIQRIVESGNPWPDPSEEAAIIRWLQAGRIVFDRAGRLDRVRERSNSATVQRLPAEEELYGAWQKIGYNLAQIQRYLNFEDPVSQEVVDWRLLYSLDEVRQAYFLLRRVPWRGEKSAIRYLNEHDPDFLDTFRRCLAEPTRDKKVALYEELARKAVSPVGEIWEWGKTVAVPGPGFADPAQAPAGGTVESALSAWRDLLGAADA